MPPSTNTGRYRKKNGDIVLNYEYSSIIQSSKLKDLNAQGWLGLAGLRPELIPLLLGVGILAADIHWGGFEIKDLLPVTLSNVYLEMSFEGQGDDFSVSTFLPETDERQNVLERRLLSGKLALTEQKSNAGAKARWASYSGTQRLSVGYDFEIASRGIRYEIDPDIRMPNAKPRGYDEHLQETPAIQVTHPEVLALWQEIKPRSDESVLGNLKSMYNYVTYDIEGAEFKGYTDALTALRLGQASCNGKSRLFVALARMNNLPARLIGGLIMNQGSKKTSHQWLEILIQERWVPFDPTNGYFAEIPSHYLTLYKGDEALFSHTRNINFDYLFDINLTRTPAPQVDAIVSRTEPASWLTALFLKLELDLEIVGTFLLLPVAALVVTVCRNVVGLNSFGVFLPMLIGAACRHTGLIVGLTGFILIVGVASVIRRATENLKLLQIPRLSALITIVTALIIFFIWLANDQLRLGVTALVLFPVIILSFTAERMSNVMENTTPADGLKLILSTFLIIFLCYLVLSSKLLEAILFSFPEILLIVLAVQVSIGRWSGLRVSEFIRFKRLAGGCKAKGQVLGINERNRRLVDSLNSPQDMLTANDKVLTKTILSSKGIPVPKTLSIVEGYWDLQQIERQLDHWYNFVVKPGMGSQGKGILVVHGRDADDFLLASGERLKKDHMLHHLEEILAGVYSMSPDRDVALIETLILPTAFYQKFSTKGLADIRVILVEGKVLAAMLRIPTNGSEGKANLHQGAIGVAVDIDTGVTGQGYLNGDLVTHHPDGGEVFASQVVPNWSRIVEIATLAQQAIPLGYIGVDIVDDGTQGPMVIEVNARAGLEIQNVHGFGFKELVERLLDKTGGPDPAKGIA